ncbi:unnamed protein product [Didymodactylos carnosus]|uniref:Uncharacterized protein n=1 Tax=Didymodactylos carnosus TaxID=1234261 RepID=A0A814EKN7_9BILA|nr:unnamed protein product [Didymodactylos carnosus]CAF3743830.1 unnamed protein product [Didymodactylos carnosus]
MRQLVKSDGMVAQLSMNPGENPMIILSYNYQIQDLRRCCTKSYAYAPLSVLSADADEFENRLIDLEDVWNIIKNNNLDNYRSSADFHDWFITYGAESFQEHLMAGVRNAAGYVNQDRSSRLFYNNDNKAIRFIHNNRVWASTLNEERQQIIKNYYSYQPPIRRQVSDFNIPTTSGRKPEKSSVRGSTTTPKSGRTSSITPKTKRGQKKQ